MGTVTALTHTVRADSTITVPAGLAVSVTLTHVATGTPPPGTPVLLGHRTTIDALEALPSGIVVQGLEMVGT